MKQSLRAHLRNLSTDKPIEVDLIANASYSQDYKYGGWNWDLGDIERNASLQRRKGMCIHKPFTFRHTDYEKGCVKNFTRVIRRSDSALLVMYMHYSSDRMFVFLPERDSESDGIFPSDVVVAGMVPTFSDGTVTFVPLGTWEFGHYERFTEEDYRRHGSRPSLYDQQSLATTEFLSVCRYVVKYEKLRTRTR